MPELPDIEVYVERLRALCEGRSLQGIRIANPFLLRSVSPPVSACAGRRVEGLSRLGKRIVWHLEDDLHVVIHLMIAGRLRLAEPGAPIPARLGQAAFDFDLHTVLFTEAGKKRRASLHVVAGRDGLGAHDRGGTEVLGLPRDEFAAVLRRENHTLKRALTDPRLFSGIGNAYSDEILHRARLSPVRLTRRLADDEVSTLHRAVQEVLPDWIRRLRAKADDDGGFPTKVTAFHDEMAVHGRYGKPCPDCGATVQRIRYADKETNYCPACQTGGRLLADRGLSRLLKKNWPRTLEELEERSAASAALPDSAGDPP